MTRTKRNPGAAWHQQMIDEEKRVLPLIRKKTQRNAFLRGKIAAHEFSLWAIKNMPESMKNPIAATVPGGQLYCEALPRAKGHYEVSCALVKPSGTVTWAKHGVFPGKAAAQHRIQEVIGWMKSSKNPGAQWHFDSAELLDYTAGKAKSLREKEFYTAQANRERLDYQVSLDRGMKNPHRKHRNPKVVQAIGNAMGGFGIIALAGLIGFIIWQNNKQKNQSIP